MFSSLKKQLLEWTRLTVTSTIFKRKLLKWQLPITNNKPKEATWSLSPAFIAKRSSTKAEKNLSWTVVEAIQWSKRPWEPSSTNSNKNSCKNWRRWISCTKARWTSRARDSKNKNVNWSNNKNSRRKKLQIGAKRYWKRRRKKNQRLQSWACRRRCPHSARFNRKPNQDLGQEIKRELHPVVFLL